MRAALRASRRVRSCSVGAFVLGEVRRDVQLLDGDLPAQQLVLGAPHRAHAAAADPLGQPVPSGDQPPSSDTALPSRSTAACFPRPPRMFDPPR